MEKKEFVITVFNSNIKIFVIYVAFFTSPNSNIDVYLLFKGQIASLKLEKASTTVSSEYSDFADSFFSEFTTKLLKYTKINHHLIKLINS